MSTLIKTPKGTTERGGGSTNEPRPVCSHGTCRNRTFHVARLVAESQGLKLPSNPGRWLREAKDLVEFSDEQITGCTRWMLERDGGKWDQRNLWPRFVAEDMPVFLRRRKNPQQTDFTEAELQRMVQ